MAKKLVRFALVLIFVSLACGAPLYADPPAGTPTPRAVAQLLVSADPNSTPTPTPFQPIGPTAIPTATITPTQAATLTPEPDLAGIVAPTPIPVADKNIPGTVNLLILGSDARPNDYGFRTDVIMFVSINPSKGRVSVISFPRDLYVTIPGWTTQRINTAFVYGGFPELAETLQYNFGIRPQYYIMTNFQGFTGIIDSLGGINVNVGAYLSDECDLRIAVNGRCTVKPGVMTMDGATALWYVRSRHSTSDFDRLRRAQEVLYGLFARFMHIDALTRLPEFYASYQKSVQTNMTLDNMLPLLPVASQVIGDSSRIHRYTVTPYMVSNFITDGGAMVLLPNYNAINAMINEALNGQ